jgi:hypothetical protein
VARRALVYGNRMTSNLLQYVEDIRPHFLTHVKSTRAFSRVDAQTKVDLLRTLHLLAKCLRGARRDMGLARCR